MADRWNDERAHERWRRERGYGRDEQAWSDEERRRMERRSFEDHEHDADWDRSYDFDRESWRDINYELRDPGYGYAAATGTRWSGYSGAPPYGGARARGAPSEPYRSPYEEREARSMDRSRGFGGSGYGRRGYGAIADQELERERQAALGRWHDRERRDEHSEPRGFFDRAADTVASWFGGQEDHRAGTWRGHRGRGPKGYRRSDQRINDDVHDILTDDPFLDASETSVAVQNGEVTLTGVVSDREAKHRAERLVERISGVDHVQNNLRIGQMDSSQPFETGNPLASPGRGFGDSVLEAQAMGKTPGKDENRQ
jgi:osmotically-inducible protein OsmY